MWPKNYKDYPIDEPLVREQIQTGKGIIGCEMHDLNGWGDLIHRPRYRPHRGLFATLLQTIFYKKKKRPEQ